MATYKGYEPKQFGVPRGRYTRAVVRTNALGQDDNCLRVAATVVTTPGNLGWASAPGLATGYAANSAGTTTVQIAPLVLNFSLLNAAPDPAFTVSLGANSAQGVLAYDAATGLGSVTYTPIAFGQLTPGVTRVELRSGGTLQGSLQTAVVDLDNGAGLYDTAQWLAFSPA